MRLKARAMDLERRVELLPPTDDPLSVLAGFDVLAMTSWEDPSPLVVFEAMMLGKVVACFAGGGGPPEQVDDTGVVVDRFSAGAMADAIESLLDDPAHGRRLGRAAGRACWNITPTVRSCRSFSKPSATSRAAACSLTCGSAYVLGQRRHPDLQAP